MKRQLRNRVLALAAGSVAFGIISACGGAGGGGLGVADGGIRGTGSSVGPVSGFGSVFVNGVEFFTSDIPNRAVESDDGIRTESDLSEGMIVRVEGEWREDGTGTAEALRYDDTLRGPIDQVAPDPSGAGEFVTVTVMGQEVLVDRQTVVEGTTFASLLGGASLTGHVRVSAWRQAGGSYRAGYIATITPDLSDVELEGSVTEFKADLDQFTIGTITVTYDEDNVVFGPGLTEADLRSAKALEVEGSLSGSVLTATSIDRDDARRFAREESDDIEFTATIDSPYAALGSDERPGEFTMGGVTVRVTSATELDDGLVLSDLGTEDLLVQVEGRFLSDTLVEAEEISLREANAKVKGAIGAIDSATGPFEVGGVRVKMTPLTILEQDDDSAQASVALVSGTQVEVEGVEKSDASGVYIEALKVEVDNEEDDDLADNEFELEGRLQSITEFPGSILVLGVQMSDRGADYDGEDDNTAREAIVSAFDASETVILEVEYSNTAGFTAIEVELEENDND
ncbi:DUF5666 domain-containing protein [Marinobacter subterrani]|uniref:DUF5666 domain-containing protein n=1 Tax=Marinobacter subterrani TaxID=1658765 RepID=UPI002355DF77|nr:DUF5666 domain-containing protein [Marinobacter subterrani]